MPELAPRWFRTQAEGRHRCLHPSMQIYPQMTPATSSYQEATITSQEQLVMVELSGIIDSDFLEKCENKCKILGIETERPILQVDRYVFAGDYEDVLGTCVFFEESTEHDAEGNQKLQLKYKCHTMKKLNMTRTLLSEKKEGEESIGGVEWLQIKDRDFSYRRRNTICNFLREQEDSEESAQAADKLTEEAEGEVSDRGNSDMNCDLENPSSLDAASIPLPDSPASEAEDSPHSAALGDAPL
ncbi:general transcription factor 3C polypeptide 6 isoform X2 [Coturnix japonica]|uniref:general transcription factor 3C polypeptide 6 isoform X2 n=1 Tax=Coturnix japonica TaxID=93934 RepID=UPI0007777D65|nr:general transcription factor 3C polypeptide 6 isoform X2 [Coturnix japonica]